MISPDLMILHVLVQMTLNSVANKCDHRSLIREESAFLFNNRKKKLCKNCFKKNCEN